MTAPLRPSTPPRPPPDRPPRTCFATSWTATARPPPGPTPPPWRTSLASTVRRRLATLRALLGRAQALGWITWELELPTEQEVKVAMAERAERERSSYLFPRHPGEADRLDLQHHALREALGRNHLAPVSSPSRVLDVGTGTGRWGFEVCWEHPGALVVGLDLVAGRGDHPGGCRRGRSWSGSPAPGDGSSWPKRS